MLGVPLGLFEIRCEHAQPAQVQVRALPTWRSSSTGELHRLRASRWRGELPNLATLPAERPAVEQARAQSAQHERHRVRRQRRRVLLAGTGHVVRELGDAPDRIDHPDPRTGPLDALSLRLPSIVL